MRKLHALFTNEMIKSTRKISVIIITILMILGVIGMGGLMKFAEVMNNKSNNANNSSFNYQKNELLTQIDSNKKDLQIAEDKLKNPGAEDVAVLTENRDSIKLQLERNQFTYDNELFYAGYRMEVLDKMFSEKDELNKLNRTPVESLSETDKTRMNILKKDIPRFESVIKNKDFQLYMTMLDEEVNADTTKSNDEKKIALEINSIRKKYNYTGESANGINDNTPSMLNSLENNKLSLLHGLNYTGNMKPLSLEDRDTLKNENAVLTYKLEHKIDTKTENYGVSTQAMSAMSGMGMFALLILLMILAGGSVSQEIATGSIKSLIISPTRRWKIFLAKFSSLFTIGLFGTLIVYIFSVLSYGVFFGFSTGSSYVFASGGTAYELNFYLYQFIGLLADFVPVLIYMLLALMLSVITRNTAAAVAISIAIYFGGNIASTFLRIIFKGEWLRFIPFYNMDLKSKLFPVAESASAAPMQGAAINNSLLFTILYMVILSFCMFYIALDSFNRRDIK